MNTQEIEVKSLMETSLDLLFGYEIIVLTTFKMKNNYCNFNFLIQGRRWASLVKLKEIYKVFLHLNESKTNFVNFEFNIQNPDILSDFILYEFLQL